MPLLREPQVAARFARQKADGGKPVHDFLLTLIGVSYARNNRLPAKASNWIGS